MTWDIRWHDTDETILILKPIAEYTWPEFQKMIEKAAMMIGRKAYEVAVIYDLRTNIPLPGPGLLLQEREVHYRTPDNIGLTVLVGARPYTRSVTRAVYQSLRDESELHFTDTLEEAVAFITTTLTDEEQDEV